jgi:uncharacterized protein YxjI
MGAGRDFKVEDTDGNVLYIVDGKVGARPKAEIKDASGSLRWSVKGHLLGFPKSMDVVDAQGNEFGTLKAKMVSPVKDRETLHLADGTEWHLKGSFLEKNYEIQSDAGPVAEVSQKWISVRDAFTVDVVNGLDVCLVLALVWSVDRWVEHD